MKNGKLPDSVPMRIGPFFFVKNGMLLVYNLRPLRIRARYLSSKRTGSARPQGIFPEPEERKE
jgi:hypothetical protein